MNQRNARETAALWAGRLPIRLDSRGLRRRNRSEEILPPGRRLGFAEHNLPKLRQLARARTTPPAGAGLRRATPLGCDACATI